MVHKARSIFSWVDHVARLDHKEFKRRYRLDVDSFYELLRMLKPLLDVCNEKQARNGKWGELIDNEGRGGVSAKATPFSYFYQTFTFCKS